MIVDTGPLLAALDEADRHHALAVRMLRAARGSAAVPDPVIAEVDVPARRRLNPAAGRRFLDALRRRVPERVTLDGALWRRAVAIDAAYGDLDLGLVDAAGMAVAEQWPAPILTFDFRDFRATTGRAAPWALVAGEWDLG